MIAPGDVTAEPTVGTTRPSGLRVAVVTNVLPHYRADFFRILIGRSDLDVHVFCQASLPASNLEVIHDRFPDHVTLVKSWHLGREWMTWQRLPWRRLLSSYDVLFITGNARILSSVALSVMARMAGRSIVIWGQARTPGAHPLLERLRLWWWRRFENLFVYTDREIEWLRERGFARHRIAAMNNGLNQRAIDSAAEPWDAARLEAWQQERGLHGRTRVLSCARLVSKNRFDLWLEAMPLVVRRHPDLLWCVIGEGPERGPLEARARQVGVDGHIRWLGAISNQADLAPWFLSSQLLVHPSEIGLSLLHAFGFGLPVVTHDDPEYQMPEFAAFVPGKTGMTYRRGDVKSLAEAVCLCLDNEPARRRMSEFARRIPRETYNVDVMAGRFAAVASAAAGSP